LIKGKVILAGAGPGDPGLIGDRALQCIKQADAIVYDRLVSPCLVALARTDAELVYVGKASSQHTMRQEEINALLVRLAKQNKSVLRLKGGDPFVFGRGGEEALHLRENGVEFEIIPGITSAIAVAAYAGIPVTHRGIATSFAVVTGHEDPEKTESGMQWDKLSTAVDTLVFLMGVENLPHITAQLLTHGRPADTPAAVIRWGTTSKQKTLVTTVGKAVADVAAAGMTPPAIFVVGQVVSLREGLRWFDIRPLFGQRILVTRAREQASRLTEELEEAGAMCLEAPTIRLTDPDSYEPLDNAIRSIHQYSWVAFTSPNGVKSFFARLKLQGKDARHLGQIKLAVIGPETAAALERQGIVADVVPAEFRAEAVVAALTGKVGPQDRVLIARAAEAREVLPQELIKLGAAVDVVAAYKTVLGEAEGALISQQMLAGEIDIVTFTSSSTVTNLVKILGDNAQELLTGVKIACIGPITADTCKENGLIPDVVATEYTIKGLVDSIIREMGGKPS
jgi:uroporphyrinogen III methyltransferase/synthase